MPYICLHNFKAVKEAGANSTLHMFIYLKYKEILGISRTLRNNFQDFLGPH